MPVRRDTPKRKAKIDKKSRVNGKGRNRSAKFKVVDKELSEPPAAPRLDVEAPGPIIPNPNEPPGTTERIVMAQIEALGLRIQGYSFPAIAARMKISVDTAYNYVNDALEASARLRAERVAQERELSAMQIDEATTYLWAGGVSQGDPQAYSALMRGVERKSKLLGLDAPQKIAPTSPDGRDPYSITIEGKKIDDGRAKISADALSGLVAGIAAGIPGADPPLLGGGEGGPESTASDTGTSA